MNFTIKNESIKAVINNYGAQLNSLKRIDDDLEYIWCADKKYWGRSSPILFPIVGKMKDDEYLYDGKTYKMSQHGFARDKVFEVVEQSESFIKFLLKSNESSKQIYPFDFELYLSYEVINNKLFVYYEVENKSDKQMYFSIGAHPAFNWPLFDESKDDCYLELNLNSSQRYFLKDGLLDNSTFMETEKIYLSQELFLDDALVFNDKINEVIFKNDKNDRYLKMDFEGFPYLGIWSKTDGAPFLCIEPWYGVSDTIIHNKKLENKKGINSLNAGQRFSSSYSIEI